METCDVLVVGGGPAGSTCAWKLRRAGLDVVVLDRSSFPRDKVCAGWITPQVIDALGLDCDEYRTGRTFQPITGFRTAVIDGPDALETRYSREVSYGIRRCEFDHYLLSRSGARLCTGKGLASMRRDGDRWIVNDTLAAPLIVGAGGHFCPVARQLNPAAERAALVAAQEAEFALDDGEDLNWAVQPETPELYFCSDLKGYGWCFRKGRYLNVGLGRIDSVSLPAARDAFMAFLSARGRVSSHPSLRWRGHAYLIAQAPRRTTVADGVVLVGDAAGLAYPESGEGIRPAIESGLLAASAILRAEGRYTRDRLEPYDRALRERFGSGRRLLSRAIPSSVTAPLVPRLLAAPWFVRHFVIDRWFLHSDVRSLAA